MKVGFYQQDLARPMHLDPLDRSQLVEWSHRLGVSADRLHDATQHVGTAVYAVQQYLGVNDSGPSVPCDTPADTALREQWIA